MKKKFLKFSVPLGFLLFLGSTHFACAADAPSTPPVSFSLFGLGDLAYIVISRIAFGISYLMAVVGAIVIAMESWLVGVMLNINTTVFDSPVVQKGFGVTLSIANLGFVLGIIVIAIATILRRETYGIKKILWKLVFAAVLVNFSLVIMGPIFGFANSLTQYFLNCIDPSVSCNAPSGFTAMTSMNDFAERLAGAFNPQRDFLSLETTANTNDPKLDNIAGAASIGGASFGKMIVPILSMVFVAVALIVIVIVLAVFVFMLLVRYVYIAILAVLMPFAWLAWIFPSLSSHWKKWWDTFFRWTFFAPIVVFFLWLAIATAASMSEPTTKSNFAMYTSNSNELWAPIANFLTNLFSPLIQNLLNEFILVGLMVGGMIAANKMSITGASAAVGAVKSVGNAMQGYATKQAKKGARWTYQRAGGAKLNERLQKSRIPFTSALGRSMAGVTEKGGKDLVKEAATQLKLAGMSDEQLLMAAQGARGKENTLAVLAEAQKRGILNKVGKIGGEENLSAWLEKNQRTFGDYDHGKLHGDVNFALDSDERMRRIAKAQGEARAMAGAVDVHGILGAPGTLVSAERLAEEARTLRKQAKDPIDVMAAESSLKNANDALRKAADEVEVSDEVGKDGKTLLGGPADQMVKAGELMRAAAEEFFKNIDRADIAKFKPGQIFGGTASFGLSREAIEALSEGVAHGLAVKTPALMPSLIGKLDSSERLQRFADTYRAAIEKAATAAGGGRISATDVTKLTEALKSAMGNRLIWDSGAAAAPTPTPTPAPTPPPGGAPRP